MESNRNNCWKRDCWRSKVRPLITSAIFIWNIFRHNNTIENVLLDGNGLTHDLIEAIRLICDRNSTNHQLQEKTKMQTSFLLQELENTKCLALDQTARFENEIDISRQEKIQLEANLWANKSKFLFKRRIHVRGARSRKILDILVELRSKLEIAESTIQEKEALLNDIHQEFEFFKKESRETQRKVSDWSVLHQNVPDFWLDPFLKPKKVWCRSNSKIRKLKLNKMKEISFAYMCTTLKSGLARSLNHALSFDLWKCLKGKRMDEIGFLKKKNIEFESELNEARRDIDSYRQQIENMNKSEFGPNCLGRFWGRDSLGCPWN